MPRMNDDAGTRLRRLLIPLLFLSTGAFALCYEVVWARYLHLFIGHTTQAYTIVLATFMGGQALGYVLFGRFADRTPRPLAFYGAIELAIGAYAVFFPQIYAAVGPAFLREAAARGLVPGSNALLAAKLISGVVLILPPAVLMGGTLPLVVRARMALGGAAGRTIARLYAINCAGAVIGTLATAYMLLPDLGSSATLVIVGSVNALVGAAALLCAGPPLAPVEATSGTGSGTGEGAGDEVAEPVRSPATALAAVLAGAFATGFAAMIYEVAWTRLLAIALGASTYAFAIMLATYIGGIALGARIAGGALAERARPLRLFGALQLATGLSIALALPLYDGVPNLLRSALQLLSRSPDAFPLYQLAQVLISASIMLVPATLGGMCLPVATRALATASREVGGAIGRAFAANTTGTLLGAALGGLVLLPLLGIRHAFTVGITANICAGTLALFATTAREGVAPLHRFVPLVLGPVILLLSLAPGFTRGALTFQTFRRSDTGVGVISAADFRSAAQDREKLLLYDEDGAAATVTVFDAGGKRVMLINGKADASTGGDVGVQLLLGHLPLLLKPEAKRVFVIGLGSGMTAGALLKHPIESLEVCEISPEVVRASRFFDDVTGAPLDDKRVKVVEEDARIALALSPRVYDVVISEPSNPWVAGIGALFTEEHFRAVSDHLADDGIAVQWFHLYESDDALVSLVLRTFQRVFPETRIFAERQRGDLLIVGAKKAGVLDTDLAALEARLASPGVREELAKEGIDRASTLLWLELMGPVEARRLPGRGPIHKDDRPTLETDGPRALFVGGRAEAVFRAAEDPARLSPAGDLLLERRRARAPVSATETAALARYLKAGSGSLWPELGPLLREVASTSLDEAERVTSLRGVISLTEATQAPGDARGERHLVLALTDGRRDEVADYSGSIEADTRHADRERSRLLPARTKNAYESAIATAEYLGRRYPAEAGRARLMHGRLLSRAGRLDEAREALEALARDGSAALDTRGSAAIEVVKIAWAQGGRAAAQAPTERAVGLAAMAIERGDPRLGAAIAERVLALDPESADARSLLGVR